MVRRLNWAESYRIIPSRFPFVGIFDRIIEPGDLQAIIAIEARTNDRILDEAGEISLVKPKDRITGPGTTPIMAAFTHTKPSRFSDGTFGIYYAARHLSTAVAESRFHTELFYRATDEPSADVDMRVYAASIKGKFDNLLNLDPGDARLDPNSYLASQAYGQGIYEGDAADGIVYPSVRDHRRHPAVACMRPSVVHNCYSHSYLQYRWDGTESKIVDIAKREALGFK